MYGEDLAAYNCSGSEVPKPLQNLRAATKAKQGAHVVGKKMSATPTPVAPPEGATILEASAHFLFGD